MAADCSSSTELAPTRRLARSSLLRRANTVPTDDLRTFAEPIGRSEVLVQKSAGKKHRVHREGQCAARLVALGRSRKSNFAHIYFSAWDPDIYLGRLDAAVGRYIYNPWTMLAAFLLLIFEFTVFISKWSFMGPDIALYYNFLNKGFGDMVQFWLLVLVLGFIHESSHGLTCKHYGGQVHSMGMMFLYLAPAFYVDVTEIWITASKVQRIYTIFAGIFSEMVICGLAMIVWVNTQTGQWIHDFAYQIILLSGVAVVVINLNPLIKLDGYYCMTELMGLPDLKERSTAFMTGWFQNQILRLPVETIVVPRRRVPLFIVYAVLSGTYSYLLLFFIVRLSYNVFSHWLADLAVIPAAYLAFVLFRSRLRSLRKVAVQFWELKVRSGRFMRPIPLLGIALVVVILFVPIWRDRESAWYVIEPAHTETLHAAVSGRLEQVLVQQGEAVHAGQADLEDEQPDGCANAFLRCRTDWKRAISGRISRAPGPEHRRSGAARHGRVAAIDYPGRRGSLVAGDYSAF